MKFYYTAERNIQMVISLLKSYGIKRVIASPGATNVELVASMQQDDFFEMYSCVDERSAAYMACGIAEETAEPVVLSCTGATSARNYMPGLTEAYYRKLPIVAITSTRDVSLVGHLIAQVTDRSTRPNDIVVDSVHIQSIKDANDEWDCTIKLNRVLHSLRKNGGGPVHINLTSPGNGDFSVKQLPNAHTIDYYTTGDIMPVIPQGKVGIFVGSHHLFNNSLESKIEEFCSIYDAVVFCDHTSNYKGKHRILYSLIGAQESCQPYMNRLELIIHIGEMSGDYDTMRTIQPNNVWRVNEDGEPRDTFKRLSKVFHMSEEDFFSQYTKTATEEPKFDFVNTLAERYKDIYNKIPELPLSNILVAKKLSAKIPDNSRVYLGILNSLRSWNFFEVPQSVNLYSNVGGFGIDGILSSLIGSSFVNPSVLFFAVVGDLSFFYDINSMGNRSIRSNVRILLINNNHGQEFYNYNHAAGYIGDDVNLFISAKGHFSNINSNVVRHYVADMGFEYLSVKSCDELDDAITKFSDPEIGDKPILLEVFTDENEESDALFKLRNTIKEQPYSLIRNTYHGIKEFQYGIKMNL